MANSNPYVLFGDFEAAIIDILNTATELSSFGITKVTSDMVGYAAGDLWVTVELEGGSYKFKSVKRPRIDITVYGPDRSVAYDVSAIAQAVVFNRAGNYRNFGVNLISVQVETDIFRSTEKDTNQVRYVQALRLICKAWPQ
jgi:hypothetical protein